MLPISTADPPYHFLVMSSRTLITSLRDHFSQPFNSSVWPRSSTSITYAEGVEFAFFRLIEFYSKGEFKDLEKGRIWFEKAVEFGFDEACFANELGVESLQCRKLKEAADAGDCVAAAKLACAYLHGVYDGGDKEYVCCVKDLDKARHYGVMACMGDDGGQMLVNILGDHIVEDQKFLSEVAQEAGLE